MTKFLHFTILLLLSFSYLLTIGHCQLSIASQNEESLGWRELVENSWKHYQSGKIVSAANSAIKALDLAEKEFGKSDPNTVVALNNLADLYRAQGEFDKAGPLYEQVLVILVKVFGDDHKNLGPVYNNIATFYFLREKNSDAEKHFLNALRVYEKSYGKDSKAILVILKNLVSVYNAQEKSEDAEKIKNRIIEIEEKQNEEVHFDPKVRFPEKPETGDFVFDGARIISEKKISEINLLCKKFKDEQDVMFFTVTIKSMAAYAAVGWDFEVYSEELFDIWASDDGVEQKTIILIISNDDRLVQIISNFGEHSKVETIFQRVKEETILSNFRKGNYSEGVFLGVQRLVISFEILHREGSLHNTTVP